MSLASSTTESFHDGTDDTQPQNMPPIHFGGIVDTERGLAREKTKEKGVVYVSFEGLDDPEHPHNWSIPKKLGFLTAVNLMTFAVSFTSSIFGTASTTLEAHFSVSHTVISLGVALFVAGFAVGPLFFGPISDITGHGPPSIVGFTVCGLLQIPIALLNNLPAILVCRFLSGAFGSAMLACGSGMTAELYKPIPRAISLAYGATMINLGSTVAPSAGSYIVARYGWRWTAWVTLIMFAAIGVVVALFLNESSPQQILVAKAKRLRATGGDDAKIIKAPFEDETVNFDTLVNKYFAKPILLICKEPILIILTVHLTFVYGTLYLTYQLFPYAFQKRGWSAATSSLPFIAVSLGVISAPGVVSIFTMTRYKKLFLEKGGKTEPEDRLPMMILGACILPPALLWFGWSMETHWISQVLAGYFIGLALQLMFISGLVYIVDVYIMCPNSAVSIHIAVRSVVAASFPLWAKPMYEALGVEYTATTLAVFSIILLPFPVLFFKFGPKIRSWSKFAKNSL